MDRLVVAPGAELLVSSFEAIHPDGLNAQMRSWKECYPTARVLQSRFSARIGLDGEVHYLVTFTFGTKGGAAEEVYEAKVFEADDLSLVTEDFGHWDQGRGKYSFLDASVVALNRQGEDSSSWYILCAVYSHFAN